MPIWLQNRHSKDSLLNSILCPTFSTICIPLFAASSFASLLAMPVTRDSNCFCFGSLDLYAAIASGTRPETGPSAPIWEQSPRYEFHARTSGLRDSRMKRPRPTFPGSAVAVGLFCLTTRCHDHLFKSFSFAELSAHSPAISSLFDVQLACLVH